jgi:hypothetical protein
VSAHPATEAPALLRIEQPIAEWCSLADAIRRTHLGTAAGAVLNHFGRVMTQVTRISASDPPAIGAIVLTRSHWHNIAVATRDAGALLADRQAHHPPADAEDRRALQTMARCFIAFADEMDAALGLPDATVWRIRCAERRAEPFTAPRNWRRRD